MTSTPDDISSRLFANYVLLRDIEGLLTEAEFKKKLVRYFFEHITFHFKMIHIISLIQTRPLILTVTMAKEIYFTL